MFDDNKIERRTVLKAAITIAGIATVTEAATAQPMAATASSIGRIRS